MAIGLLLVLAGAGADAAAGTGADTELEELPALPLGDSSIMRGAFALGLGAAPPADACIAPVGVSAAARGGGEAAKE